MQKPESASAARTLCESFLDAFVPSICEHEFPLIFYQGHTSLWPRPSPTVDSKNVEMVAILNGGIVDFARVKQACTGPGRVQTGWKLWKAISPIMQDSVQMSFKVFLTKAVAVPALRSMTVHIIQAITGFAEKTLGDQVTKKAKGVLIKFVWEDDAVGDLSSTRVDKFVAQYLVNSVESQGEVQDMSLATDKGWAKGLPYQVSIVGLPNNFACVALPVVLGLIYPYVFA